MNLSKAQLKAQYLGIRDRIGELIDAAEKAFSLPPRIMWAIYSRETNLDPYWVDHPGDGGHGHGLKAKLGQVDDRSWDIPDDWRTNLAWQIGTSAQIFSANYNKTNDVVKAANMYNSGQTKTEYTTGKDYGPDVYDRWQALLEMFPPSSTPDEQEKETMGENLTSIRSGLVLKAKDAGTESRTKIIQDFGDRGAKEAEIIFTPAGEGTVLISFAHAPDLVFDEDPNVHVLHLFQKAGVDWQRWWVETTPEGSGIWRIRNFVTGWVIDVTMNSDEPGVEIQTWEDLGNTNQRWVRSRFR